MKLWTGVVLQMKKTLTNYTKNLVYLSEDKITLSAERRIWSFWGVREDIHVAFV